MTQQWVQTRYRYGHGWAHGRRTLTFDVIYVPSVSTHMNKNKHITIMHWHTMHTMYVLYGGAVCMSAGVTHHVSTDSKEHIQTSYDS